MNLSNRLELTQTQKLMMTAQLKQSLEILNMSSLELEQEIKRKVEENPMLEIENRENINHKSYKLNHNNLDNDLTWENTIKSEYNLYDYIKFQLGTLNINKKERKVCEYIVDCLDKDGYLICDEKVIMKELNISEKTFNDSLKYIQQLEPSGIGARNLSECLLIQMDNKNIKDDILKSIILNDLVLIGENKIKLISKKYNMNLEECVKYIEKIKLFNPKPGRLYSDEKSIYIQPDVIIKKINDEFIVHINDNENFNLYVNNYYKDILNNSSTDKHTKEFIKNKLNYALTLLKNIDNRKNTILKIAQIILKEQVEFFNKGLNYIKPMKIKDIAYNLGYHESTISRGISNKYMLTPYGLFEFKYFFSSTIEGKEEETSSTKIKSMIKELINSENKLKPLSDDKICKLLDKEGIKVARRTVAKYREEMNILSSSKRKQFL